MTAPRRSPVRALAFLAVLAALAAPAAGRADSSPDDRARYLAGLPVDPGSPLARLEEDPAWKVHAAALDRAWETVSARLQIMQGWAATEVWPRIRRDAPLLYLFGGPDALNALALYPEAPVYVLAGLEPVGHVPAPETIPAPTVDAALDQLDEALRTVVRASFFRTIEMKHDLRGKGIDGVLPVAYLFIVRSGARVLASDWIEIDPIGGTRVVRDDAEWRGGIRGLRIRFERPGRLPQVLFYVSADLSDDAMRAKPGFAAFVHQLGPANALLKAASFILHDHRFSSPKAVLLRSALSVLQDDSGLPFSAFAKGEWDFGAWGRYLVPKPPFQRAWQPELARLFQESARGALPFTYGYRHGAEESSLLLAVRKAGGPLAAPAAADVPALRAHRAPRVTAPAR